MNRNLKDVPPEGVQDVVGEKQVEEAKHVLHLLGKTVSQVKIYPPDHISVKKTRDELYENLIAYLEKNWKLEIDIREFAFDFQDITVYRDPSPMKSLPFLFFKDGMQKLFFYKGLDMEELQEFLKLIRKYFELPPDEADIVSLLWEKDFANIRYFAPDDYLETKIGLGKGPVEIKIDRERINTGTIELASEDRRALTINVISELPEKIQEKTILEDIDESDAFQVSSLTETERETLKSILEENRRISPEKELFLLIFEILGFEEDLGRISSTFEVLDHELQDIVQKGDFHLAAELLKSIFELRQSFSSSAFEKTRPIDKYLNKLRKQESLPPFKDILLRKDISDFSHFFDYLDILDPESLSFLGELYDEINSADFRLKTLNFLKAKSKKDFTTLIDVVQQERASLSAEVIDILSTIEDRKAIQLMANFIPFRNKSIKIKAIEYLGRSRDVTASKILIGFLSDNDEGLRVLAAKNIHHLDSSVLRSLLSVVEDKKFQLKSRKEKQAVIDLLTLSQDKKAYKVLEQMLKRPGLLFSSKRIESGLCAAQALEKTGAPEAISILEKGIRVRNKKIRQACRQSLTRTSTS